MNRLLSERQLNGLQSIPCQPNPHPEYHEWVWTDFSAVPETVHLLHDFLAAAEEGVDVCAAADRETLLALIRGAA